LFPLNRQLVRRIQHWTNQKSWSFAQQMAAHESAWTTISGSLEQLDEIVDAELLKYLSPLDREPINLSGDYQWKRITQRYGNDSRQSGHITAIDC
jgi:hypothetical protein